MQYKKCKTIRCAKPIGCAKKKTVYWDLINSDMNRRDVQTGYSGYVHKKNGWWEYGCISSNNLVSVYETGFVFRSLMAWGKKLLLSLSVFAIMLLKRLPDGSKQKDGYRGELSLWWFLQLCFCSVWGRWPAEREEQTLRCVQLNARLSAELCSPGLRNYHTTLRCTESIHFL